MRWRDSVRRAVDRFCERSGSDRFTLGELVLRELPRIVREAETRAALPSRALKAQLRELVRRGELEELAEGEYRRLRKPPGWAGS